MRKALTLGLGLLVTASQLSFAETQAKTVTLGSVASETQPVGSVSDTTFFSAEKRDQSVYFRSDIDEVFGTRFCPMPDQAQVSPSLPGNAPASIVSPDLAYRLDQPPTLFNPNTEDFVPLNCGRNDVGWILRNWQVRAGATGGKVQLKLYRAQNSQDLFTAETHRVEVMSQEQLQTAEPNQVNTFSVERPLTQGEITEIIDFGAAVIGNGPSLAVDKSTTVTPQNLGVVSLPGNLPLNTPTPIQSNAVDTTKMPNLAVTLESDFDRDGVRESIDDDNDGDGVANQTDNCRWVKNADQKDANGNSIGTACDNVESWEKWRDGFLKSDEDKDTVAFKDEMVKKTDVCDSDSDDDGITDGAELNRRTDPRQRDTDRDGITDGVEIGLKRLGATTLVYRTCRDSRPGQMTFRQLLGTNPKRFRHDRDPKTKTNPRRRDTDGDRISDGREDKNHNGRVDRNETDPRNRN